MNVRIEMRCSSYPGMPAEDITRYLTYLTGTLSFDAYLGDDVVSRLVLSRHSYARSWEVGNVQTHPAYLRQGLATGLYRHAEALVGQIEHSVMRSSYGDSWARSMGHEVPEAPVKSLSIDNFDLWAAIYEPTAAPELAQTIAKHFGTGSYRCTAVSELV